MKSSSLTATRSLVRSGNGIGAGLLRRAVMRLTQLHAHEAYAGLPELAARLPGLDAADLPRLCASDAIGDFVPLQALLHQLTDAADQLSDDIARRHFIHSGDVGRSLGA